MVIRWTKRALRNLAAVYEYIEFDNPRAASETVSRLVDGVEMLARHPEMGRLGRTSGTRELILSPYIVGYRVKRSEISVLAIIHGARKWPDVF